MDSLSSFLNVKEVSAYLALRTSTVYSLVEERKIPHYRIGRQIRFKKSVIDQWTEEQKQPVIDAKVVANKVVSSVQKKAKLDIDRIVEKVIEESKGKRYSLGYGDQVKSSTQEGGDHGII